MELLFIDVTILTLLSQPGDSAQFGWTIGSLPEFFKHLDDPLCIFTKTLQALGNPTGTGETMPMFTMPFRYDFQDANGHGYLLATDSFNVQAERTNSNVQQIFEYRMYYRFIDISLVEYIGIVQSTTQT